MQNDNYEDDLNEVSDRAAADDNFGDSREDETRERSRRGYRESPESARHGEGREKSASYLMGGDGDKNRVLLKAVNDVLNQYFPLKTLISAVEFEVFRDYVFQKVPEFAEDPASFLSEIYPQRDISTDEELDEAIDSILRELFFHAGGTLVGKLESRKSRLAKRVAYFSIVDHFDALKRRTLRYSKPNNKKEEGENWYWYNVNLDSSRRDKIRDDFDLISQFTTLLKNGIISEKNVALEIGAVDPKKAEENASVKETDADDKESKSENAVWRSSCDMAEEIVKRYFKEKILEPYDFETFRRLFFLKARLEGKDGKTSGLENELCNDVEEAVDEVFTTFDEFDSSLLESFFETLNGFDEEILAGKTPTEIDEILLLALEIIRESMNQDDGAEFLTSDSDFSSEYLLIAKYVVKSRFRNRQFNRDFSDFGDFYKEFLRIAGPQARATEEEVRAYFIEAGGAFRSEPAETSEEEKGPLSRSEAIKKILVEEYPNGLDVFDKSELDAFRVACEKLGAELEQCSSKVRSAVCRNAILSDCRAWALSDDLKRSLGDAVDSILRNNTLVVYYESFFEKNCSWLISSGVSDWRVLRSFIAARFPRFMFYERYFEGARDEKGELYKVLDEILRLWGAPTSVRTIDELVERCYIPRDLIRLVLGGFPKRFSPSGDGFTLNDSSDVSLKNDRFAGGDFDSSVFYGDGKTFMRLMVDEVKDRESEISDEDESAPKTVRSTESKSLASEKTDEQKSASNAEFSISSSADDDWRKKANLVAKILSQNFKEGLLLNDSNETNRFRALAAEKNLDLSRSDDELLKLLKRVGFVCDGRLYVVSKKTKEAVVNLVDGWFNRGGGVIYYETFFERHQNEFREAGVVTVEALKNRLWKYLPDYDFSKDGEYFTAKEDDRTVFEIVRDDLLLAWDGAAAKRVTELEKMVYAPRRALEKTLRGYRDYFEVLLNGFWKRVDATQKSNGAKKKDSKK